MSENESENESKNEIENESWEQRGASFPKTADGKRWPSPFRSWKNNQIQLPFKTDDFISKFKSFRHPYTYRFAYHSVYHIAYQFGHSIVLLK